ncbi:MAG: hypothetical protein WCW68_14095, partial [Methanothrix sp.]
MPSPERTLIVAALTSGDRKMMTTASTARYSALCFIAYPLYYYHSSDLKTYPRGRIYDAGTQSHMPMKEQPRFLPMSLSEARTQGIEQFDVILISGDAYVDHPS